MLTKNVSSPMSVKNTPLDLAKTTADSAGTDGAQLTFYARLLDSELNLLLDIEPMGDRISPRIFDLQSGRVVLAFDLSERLVEFTGQSAPSAILSGRQLIEMLAGQGIGLGINLDVAPSSTLLDADAISWLCGVISNRPREMQARPKEVVAPSGIPESVLQALDAKLARAVGLAEAAYLVDAIYEDEQHSHLLSVIDPVPGAEDALARAVSEAFMFCGVEEGTFDIAFFRASDPICAKFAKVGLRFDLPEPKRVSDVSAPAPGCDPNKPPILR